MPDCTTIRGVSYPSLPDFTLVVNDIQLRVSSDPVFAASYFDDNRVHKVLGSYGLSQDVQKEFLQDANRQQAASSCVLTCWSTCWFTDCAITNINIA